MPDAASRFLEQMPEPAGLLLLDTQNRPVAWIPMDASEMTKLRTGDSATGAARIMRALARLNADRKSVVSGKRVSDSIDFSCRTIINRQHATTPLHIYICTHNFQ